MKRILIKIITLLTAVLMSLSFLNGCNLVSVDNQKDMDQVVATISIGNGAPTKNIYKKDLVIMYMNYGSSYVQNNGYTQKQAFELIMTNLVNNVLLVQTAEKEYAEEQNITSDIYNVDNYLTQEEIAKATYNTNKSFNDLIDNYKKTEDKDEKETETVTDTARTTPKDAKNYEPEHEGFETFLDFYNDYNTKEGSFLGKGIVTGFDAEFKTTDVAIKKAYNKLLKALDVNALLGDNFNFDKDSIYDTEYYKSNLKSEKESILLENYQKKLTYQIMKEVSYEDIESRYSEMYTAQYEKYEGSSADYESALDGASKSNPVLYNPYSGYSYVYNLLIGVDDNQKAEIDAIKAEKNITTEEIAVKREAILRGIVVKDQRATWLTSGYDYDALTKTFTGDYSFAGEGYRIPFQGEVVCTNEDEKLNDDNTENEDYKATYKATSLTEFSVKEFIDFVDTQIYGSSQTAVNNSGYYKAVKNTSKPEEYDNKVTDLLFAFSTDPGSLNTYKGYLVKPKADVGNSETYVTEFAKAARLVTSSEYGEGSYIVVGTDYGYHIMFNASTITAQSGYNTLNSYLDSLGEEKKIGETSYTTWKDYYNAMLENIDDFDDSDFYLYTLQQAYIKNTLSTKLNQKQTSIINKYKTLNDDGKYEDYNKDFVNIYTSRYKEFLKDTKASSSSQGQN